MSEEVVNEEEPVVVETESTAEEEKEPVPQKAEFIIEEKIQEIVEAEKRNGAEGVWNESQYRAGFHNGIVMCLHLLGVRDVQYKDLIGEGIGMPTLKAPETKPEPKQDYVVVADPR